MTTTTVYDDDWSAGWTQYDAFRRAYGAERSPRCELVPTPDDQEGHAGDTCLHIPFDLAIPTPAPAPYRGDCNRFVQLQAGKLGLRHFAVGGRVSLANRPGDVQTSQRKLLYLWSWPQRGAVLDATGKPSGGWAIHVTAWGGTPTRSGGTTPLRLQIESYPGRAESGGVGYGPTRNYAARIAYNKAFDLELRMCVNALGARDGYAELLLDGKSVLRFDGLGFCRGGEPLGWTRYGCQINQGSRVPNPLGAPHEDRYWSRIYLHDLGA